MEFINRIKDTAIAAALGSGEIIKKYFRNSRGTYQSKDDHSSLVTAADIDAENYMRFVIEKQFPDHGIQGEELGIKKGESEYYWVLDPIDGTNNFAMGKPIFGTLIALYKNDIPIFGLIYQPVLNEMFIGIKGNGSFLNGNPVRVATSVDLKNCLMATNPPYMFNEPKEKKVLWGLYKDVHSVEFGGDCYNYAMLSAGHLDIVLTSGDDFHDFAAVIPVIIEAGGIITDWDGNNLSPRSSGHIIASSNKELHDVVLKKIREYNL